jgi:hypothetical protein
MKTIQFILLIALQALAFTQPKQRSPVETKTPPFTDPIIIENGPAEIELVPNGFHSYIKEVPNSQGRDWTVSEYCQPVAIEMSIDNNPEGMPKSLNLAPILIEFDRNVSGNRTHTGFMLLYWLKTGNYEGNLMINSFHNQPNGNNKLHWRHPNMSKRIIARGGEPFRLRLVRFHDDQGNPACFPVNCQPITGNRDVTLKIRPRKNVGNCN